MLKGVFQLLVLGKEILVGRAHVPLQDFSGRGFGKRIHQHDFLGDFKRRQLFFAAVDDFLLGYFFTAPDNHKSRDRFHP